MNIHKVIQSILIATIIGVSQFANASSDSDKFSFIKATESSSWAVNMLNGTILFCLVNTEEDANSSPGGCVKAGEINIKNLGFLAPNSTGTKNSATLMIVSKSDWSVYQCHIQYDSPKNIRSSKVGCYRISSLQ